MRSKYHSIRWELFLVIGLPLFIIYLVVLGITYYDLRKDAYADMNDYMTELATHYAEKFDGALASAARVAKTSAAFLSLKTDFSEKDIYQLLHTNVAENPAIYGSAAAFEEGAFSPEIPLFGPYVYRNDSTGNAPSGNLNLEASKSLLREMDIAKDAYDYRKWDWYKLPQKSGTALWTEPYFDQGAGNVIMCTYSAPIVKDKKFRGVVTVDIRVQDLQKFIDKDGLVARNAFVIVSHEGRYITHPRPDYIMRETIFSNAEKVKRPELISLGHKMTAGQKGTVLIRDFSRPKKIFLFYAPISSTGWSFAADVPEEEVMRPVWLQLEKFSAVMLGGLLLTLILLLMISSKITEPVVDLAAAAKKLGSGNFEIPLKKNYGRNEIGDLGESFRKMVQDLKNYTEALTRETAARQQLESELQLARSIQLSLLPKKFPARTEFDLYAKNYPAHYVSGDFFDFFFIGEHTLAFTIADVSGKGISSAMVMVITRTLLRNLALKNKPPAEVLDEINRVLVGENENGMFVTLFLGYYHTPTGELRYANAGHYPPFCLSAGGTLRDFGAVTGLPLGISDSVKYEMERELLGPGETLILYTDGFTEARTSLGKFLGEDGFQELLKHHAEEPVTELCEKVFRAASDFQQQKLRDDLTLLILRRLP